MFATSEASSARAGAQRAEIKRAGKRASFFMAATPVEFVERTKE
jgi:hypothetical protein